MLRFSAGSVTGNGYELTSDRFPVDTCPLDGAEGSRESDARKILKNADCFCKLTLHHKWESMEQKAREKREEAPEAELFLKE